jgi:hypothetical protein
MQHSFSCIFPHIHFHPYLTLRRLDPSWVDYRRQNDSRILPLSGGKIHFI